jgi:hypothetical protein
MAPWYPSLTHHPSAAVLDADSLATPLRTALLQIAAAAAGQLSEPARHAEATTHLPYLQAVILETLRAAPALRIATTATAAPVQTTHTTTSSATDASTGATTTTTTTTTTAVRTVRLPAG